MSRGEGLRRSWSDGAGSSPEVQQDVRTAGRAAQSGSFADQAKDVSDPAVAVSLAKAVGFTPNLQSFRNCSDHFDIMGREIAAFQIDSASNMQSGMSCNQRMIFFYILFLFCWD